MERRKSFVAERRPLSAFALVVLSSVLVIGAGGCGTEPSDAGPDEIDSGEMPEETLESRCTATCQKMQSLSFPTALCEDAEAKSHDAYFCDSIYWSPCVDSCIAAVVEAPTDACRDAWDPVMSCIALSEGYISLVFSQPVFGGCRGHIDNVAKACWGQSIDP
jgi:hypothetical protein